MDNVIKEIKSEFPIFDKYPDLVYLDNSATTQKPKKVINTISRFLSESNSNVHRGLYDLAVRADSHWLNAHKNIAKYINASSYEEVFFVKNASEGLNIISGILTKDLSPEDVVVISKQEHHSNYLPWIFKQKEIGFKLELTDINEKGELNPDSLKNIFKKYGEKVKVVSVTAQSNVLGNLNPLKDVAYECHKYGALLIVDGAQSIAHTKIDVKDMDCDFFIFSGHKVYGPSGSGVVYGRKELLENVSPYFYGGEMVKNVSDQIAFADLPWKFETGTPALESNIGLSDALLWFSSAVDKLGGWDKFEKHTLDLTKYATKCINEIDTFKVISCEDSLGIISFVSDIVHPHDLASLLNNDGIAIRAGFHCAQPLHEFLHLNSGSTRISLGIYNTKDDIEKTVESLKKIVKRFK